MSIGFTPCRSRSPEDQVLEFLDLFGKHASEIEVIWVYPSIPEELITICKWDYTYEENCEYIVRMVEVLKRQGFKTGVATIPKWW